MVGFWREVGIDQSEGGAGVDVLESCSEEFGTLAGEGGCGVLTQG